MYIYVYALYVHIFPKRVFSKILLHQFINLLLGIIITVLTLCEKYYQGLTKKSVSNNRKSLSICSLKSLVILEIKATYFLGIRKQTSNRRNIANIIHKKFYLINIHKK